MPSYSFNERFVPMVLDGSKKHTVRNRRRYPARIGSTLYLYFGLRTKWSKKIREETCVYTQSLSISKKYGIVFYGVLLTEKQLKLAAKRPLAKSLPVLKVLPIHKRDVFAWLDGFRPDGTTEQEPAGAYDLMLRFWSQTHNLPWAGDIIYWEPTKAGLAKVKSKSKK